MSGRQTHPTTRILVNKFKNVGKIKCKASTSSWMNQNRTPSFNWIIVRKWTVNRINTLHQWDSIFNFLVIKMVDCKLILCTICILFFNVETIRCTEERREKLNCGGTVCILQGSTFLPNTSYSVEPANFETTLLLVERFDENSSIVRTVGEPAWHPGTVTWLPADNGVIHAWLITDNGSRCGWPRDCPRTMGSFTRDWSRTMESATR